MENTMDKIAQLKNWVGALRRNSIPLEDFVKIHNEFEHADEVGIKLSIFTEEREYLISACDKEDTVGYLGGAMTMRKE